MILGLRTQIYPAPNLEETKQWFAKTLGIAPYFDMPFYVGFNVGGYELGLDPDATETKTYWGVVNIEDAVAHFESNQAKVQAPIEDVGDGIKVATVIDPFGNVIGLIENPHFKIA